MAGTAPDDAASAEHDLPLSPAAHHALGHAHLAGIAASLGQAAHHFSQSAPPPDAGDGQADNEPDADASPRGNDRFTAASAQGRAGFPADSGAARTLAAMRGKS